jgi:hypothetical protein
MQKISYIRDVTANYVFLTHNKLDKFGKLGLQIEFSKDRVEELKEFGNIKVLDNGNFGININTSPTKREIDKITKQPTGNIIKKMIPIIDAQKNPVTAIIGNGSKIDLKVFTYKHDKAYNGQKTAPLAMLVKELKEYIQEDINDFDILPADTQVNTSQSDF